MFGKKKAEIKRLRSLIHLKESERKTAWEVANEDKKHLAAALRDKGMMRAALYENRGVIRKKDQQIEELKAQLREAHEETQAEVQREADKRKKIYAACAKMREMIRDQREYIDVLTNNISALGVTIEEMQRECAMRYSAECELRGQLDVYCRFLGKLEDKSDDRISSTTIQGESEHCQRESCPAETDGQGMEARDVQRVLDDAD